MMHLTVNHTVDSPAEVRFYPDQPHASYAVQVFLGDSYHSMYMTPEYARAFAEEILRVVPAPAARPRRR